MKPTAVIYSPDFLLHDTGPHPECPSRVSAIKPALEKIETISWVEPREAQPSDILRCHTEDHYEMVLRACDLTKSHRRVGLDPDTIVSAGSLRAALLGSGGTLTAIDAVMNKDVHNAFVLVRPPGHHATPDRAMGFCLFNNVAIGARYIQEKHNLERVLIVDWDVHHGNGTQDIFYAEPSVFYYSLHQFPHYPGTGSRFETGTGTGKGYTLNVPLPGGTSAVDHLTAFREGFTNILARFKPDFILISAGFDAHIFDPLGDLNLEDEDFVTMTRDVKRLADEYCNGRIVSLLEGGYNLQTLPATVASHLKVLAE